MQLSQAVTSLDEKAVVTDFTPSSQRLSIIRLEKEVMFEDKMIDARKNQGKQKQKRVLWFGR
jgi:hypothetical protein